MKKFFREAHGKICVDKRRLSLAELERGESEVFTDTHEMFAKILAEEDDDV